MISQDELTPAEKRAIQSLKRLAKKWPKSLWLFSASGTLCVMRYGPGGQQMTTNTDGMDPNFQVESVDIPNDGGDW